MKNLKSYYSAPIQEFFTQSTQEIIGIITSNNTYYDLKKQQTNTWEYEVSILKNQLKDISDGRIIFEYIIPRMGKRVDTVLLHKNIIFLLEFKCGDNKYRKSTYDQIYDYALDLKNFQKESHDKLIVPIMISTNAEASPCIINEISKIIEPIKCNSNNIYNAIQSIANQYNEPYFNYVAWENSEYFPTPTIIEAAKSLYKGHNVHDITRSDSSAENLTATTNAINNIIEHSKKHNKKSICFVTGVPGAGKTLVGLNLAIQRSNSQQGEHAVFLSGNLPLVTVLQHALARDKVIQEKESEKNISKQDALREVSAFIQIIHKYRDTFVNNSNIPPERIAIFDEAQRAWTHEMIKKFMQTKKKITYFPYSEPEFLINTMNRHQGWAVIICLIGGGQEINTGEAGLPEWFDSLRRAFSHWDVYITPQLNDTEYHHGREWKNMLMGLHTYEIEKLHLATSIRSFRTPEVSSFVKSLLDTDKDNAKHLYLKIKNKYPIVITRDFGKAKEWIRHQCKGSTRYGLLASSGALRLKPEGIFVKNNILVENWFLNDKDDVRSSYLLEDVATEFDIQGLELDYTLLAWDADFRFTNNTWTYYIFRGTKWNKINSKEKQLYLKNAYRVLLTRARQGMVIFIPTGDNSDLTRQQEYYDGTYNYFLSLGVTTI